MTPEPDEILLFGTNPQNNYEAFADPVSLFWWTLAGGLTAVVIVAFNSRDRGAFLFVAMVVAALCVPIGLLALRHWWLGKCVPPEPLVVRFSYKGVGGRVGYGPIRLRSWRRKNTLRIRYRGAVVRISMGREFGPLVLHESVLLFLPANEDEASALIDRLRVMAGSNGVRVIVTNRRRRALAKG